MLGERLLKLQLEDKNKIEKILSFLCSDSGSHDYTIYRQEARDVLGLNIERPDDELYAVIKELHGNIAEDLELTKPFDRNMILGNNPKADYKNKRCVIESVEGGSHFFISEGSISKQNIIAPPAPPQLRIVDNRDFEGWKYEPPQPED